MKKTLKIPKELSRAAMVTEEGESKRISISSDTPYLRYDWMNDEEYWEVLSHDPEDIDTERLAKGLPILFNHRRDSHLGRATKFNNSGTRLDVGTMADIIWSESADAQSKKKDVENGSLVGTSVGYSVLDEGTCIGAKDGKPIYKFKWGPHEFSFCTIEADTTVGAGRQRSKTDAAGVEIPMQEISVEVTKDIDSPSKETNTNKQQDSSTMKKFTSRKFNEADKDAGGGKKEEVVIDVVAERAEGRKAYKAACKKIDEYVGGLKNPQWKAAAIEVAAKHKDLDDPNFEEFRSECFTKFDGVQVLTQEQANPNVGIDRAAIRRFSFRKLMLELHSGKGLTGVEKEVCEFSAKEYKNKDSREFKGACIPSDITDARVDETYDLNKRGLENLAWEMRRLESQLGRTMNASTFASGGFLVGTELLAGSFIEYLRNACFIGQGVFGIIELGGLVGNVAIPKQTTTAQTYWLPEGGAVTASEFAGSQLYGTPHRLACLSQWTKQLLLQSTPSVEMLVRNDQARAVAVEEDRVVYQGSGASGEPIGIINTTGVDASVTFSGNWTQAKSLAFQYAIENANANTVGQMVFVTNPLSKSYAMGTLQVSASTFGLYIWMDSNGQFPTIAGSMGGKIPGVGYPAYSTKNMTSRVLFGIYNNNVTKFRWGGMDMLVEAITGAATETVKSYLNGWMDVGCRYPQAFSYSTDAPTAP